MSAPTTLYDMPGPRTKRRIHIVTTITTVALAALIVLITVRLATGGQFSHVKWGPIIDPRDRYFEPLWRRLISGFGNTVLAAVLSITISLLLGSLVAVVRLLGPTIVRIPVAAVVEICRAMPVLITIYYVSRVLPGIGIPFESLPGGAYLWYLVIGLVTYHFAVISEIIRAGVGALPRGQRDAALSIGMTRSKAMFFVELPQAFRNMMPALISELVNTLKDTTAAALVLTGFYELLRNADLASIQLRNPLQLFGLVGAIYILVNWALSMAADRSARGRRRDTVEKQIGLPTT